jgi:hypothetical protein
MERAGIDSFAPLDWIEGSSFDGYCRIGVKTIKASREAILCSRDDNFEERESVCRSALLPMTAQV